LELLEPLVRPIDPDAVPGWPRWLRRVEEFLHEQFRWSISLRDGPGLPEDDRRTANRGEDDARDDQSRPDAMQTPALCRRTYYYPQGR
jgi:hypothetical protein